MLFVLTSSVGYRREVDARQAECLKMLTVSNVSEKANKKSFKGSSQVMQSPQPHVEGDNARQIKVTDRMKVYYLSE